MGNNLFTDNQIEYLYSDKGFLAFVNKYFSSFSTCIQDAVYSLMRGNISDIDIEIYLRIMLANIETLHELISDLENYLSMSQVNFERTYVGKIQGRLDIGKYSRHIKQIPFSREYPCISKKNTYLTPENIYIIYIIRCKGQKS